MSRRTSRDYQGLSQRSRGRSHLDKSDKFTVPSLLSCSIKGRSWCFSIEIRKTKLFFHNASTSWQQWAGKIHFESTLPFCCHMLCYFSSTVGITQQGTDMCSPLKPTASTSAMACTDRVSVDVPVCTSIRLLTPWSVGSTFASGSCIPSIVERQHNPYCPNRHRPLSKACDILQHRARWSWACSASRSDIPTGDNTC